MSALYFCDTDNAILLWHNDQYFIYCNEKRSQVIRWYNNELQNKKYNKARVDNAAIFPSSGG